MRVVDSDHRHIGPFCFDGKSLKYLKLYAFSKLLHRSFFGLVGWYNTDFCPYS